MPLLPASLLLSPASEDPPGGAADGRPLPGSASPPCPAALHVLVVDDLPTNREMLRRMMLYLGYTVATAENGEEAVVAMERERFDFVLMDLQMPRMDGMEATREIIRRRPDASQRPLIFALTANVLPGTRETCLAAGMNDYLTKPVLPPQVRECVERHLALARAAAAAGGPIPGLAAGVIGESPYPWVDAAQLTAMLEGLPGEDWSDTLRELQATAVADYESKLPLLDAACRSRDGNAVGEIVHGLKGCFSLLGWTRFAEHCGAIQAQARLGAILDWESLPNEIHRLYLDSTTAMRDQVRQLRARHGASSSGPRP